MVHPSTVEVLCNYHDGGYSYNERLGQYFVNRYIKTGYDDLFYEPDNAKTADMINEWLEFHCYTDTLPKRLIDD